MTDTPTPDVEPHPAGTTFGDWVLGLAGLSLLRNWYGGFFCPCHGSKFDLAGRVFKGVPAPTNLRVPPYRFVRDDVIIIGADTGVA